MNNLNFVQKSMLEIQVAHKLGNSFMEFRRRKAEFGDSSTVARVYAEYVMDWLVIWREVTTGTQDHILWHDLDVMEKEIGDFDE